MSASTELGPFQPGTGRPPPYLAGREEEQSLFRSYFEVLRRGGSAPAEILLYGPRGNGKTALLRWAKREVDAEDGLDVLWLVGSDLLTAADLVDRVRLGSRVEKPGSPSLGGVGVPRRPGGDRPPLAEALEARAEAGPLLVLLDEAHTLKPEVGLWLLNAAQTAGRRAPFLLVLAGPPDLSLFLSGIGAGFMGRAEQLRVGRLDETATAEAIRRPLAEDGITVEAAALERIVRDSCGYPYFVQLWGRAVWRRVRGSAAGAGAVTTAVVEEAAGDFEAERNDYYLDRLRELEKRNLLPAARAVAAAFREETLLSHTAFDRAVAQGGGDGPAGAGAAEALERLGLVWHTRGTPSREPGIPGLTDYIVEHAPPAKEGGGAGG